MSNLSEAEISEIERMAGAPASSDDSDGNNNPPDVLSGNDSEQAPSGGDAGVVETESREGLINFNEVFQGYEKPEDVLSTLSKVKEYEARVKEFEDKVKEFEQKNTTLSSELNKYNGGLLPGETEELFKLRMINKNSPEKYDLAKKLINNAMSPMDLIKENLKNSPEMEGLTEEEINLYVEDRYSLEKPYDEDEETMAKYNEKLKRLEIQKKIDAAKAKNELMGIFSDIQLPTQKSEEELSAEQTKRAESFTAVWRPVFQDALKQDVKITAPVKDEQGNEISLVDIPVPADIKESYLKDLGNVYFNSNVELNEKSRNSVTEYVQKRYISEHFDTVVMNVATKAAQAAREMNNEQWMKSKYNPRNLKGVDNNAPATPPKKTTESEFEAAMSNF